MAALGRITVDARGTILAVDQAFCTTLRAAQDVLLGSSILDLTSPADRAQCIVVLAEVQQAPEPMITVKRMIRSDGTHFWVHNTVEAIPASDGVLRIGIALQESAPPSGWIDPSDLLRVARYLFAGRRKRNAVFRDTLFSDHAWDILLAAYISEAEGRVLTTTDLHALIGISPVNASRWMRALSTEGLMEYEDDTATTASSLRLTCAAHQRFESYLTDMQASDPRPPAPNF